MKMSMAVWTRTNQWREAARRAWVRVIRAWHAKERTSEVFATREHSLVSALCTCVLDEDGDGGDRATGGWPPRSVEELMRHQPHGVATAKLTGNGLESLLEQGLAVLDAVAVQETGQPFSHANRSTQMRALFLLECGRGGLPRHEAAAFIDAFLMLAAHAYLRDAPTPGAAI